MLKARRYTLILDDIERHNLQNRDMALVRRTFVNYVVEHKITRDTHFEIETALADAISYGFIHQIDNGSSKALSVTTKGRNVIKKFGLGWIFLVEYYIAQLTTLGALVTGLLVGAGSVLAFFGQSH